MQQQLSSDDSLSILKKPEYILSFIKQVLEPQRIESSRAKAREDAGLRMEDLRIVPEEPEDELRGRDSDDEEENAEGVPDQPRDEMKSIAVKLLLSVLEGTFSHLAFPCIRSPHRWKRIPTYPHETRQSSTTCFPSSNHSRRRQTERYATWREKQGWS